MQQIQLKFGSLGQGPEAGCAATIGTFDGVHLGHQAILQRLREKAKTLALPTAVIVFEPQPYEFFKPDAAPARIMPLREKIHAFAQLGIDYVVCLRFNRHLRQLTAQQFIDEVLVKDLAIKHLEVGDDFRFGCDRQGDFALLEQAGLSSGFSVANCQTLLTQGERVSSTRIRQLLGNGELGAARALLGRPFSLSGRVSYGRQLGQSIGVPTANIALGHYRLPMRGVFAVKVQLGTERTEYAGVANLGSKPTIEDKLRPSLETHLFNFSGDLYGQCIKVAFYKKLRDEQKFASIEALQQAIAEDIKNGKAYFAAEN